VWRAAGNILSFERDCPGVRGVFTCYDIEQGGFTGSVGTHEPHNFAFPDVKAYIVESNQAAETFGHPLHRKNWFIHVKQLCCFSK
jgi:hypothetical protein